MLKPKPMPMPKDQSVDSRIYPDMPNHAATEAEFIALVEAGIASFEAVPTFDLAAVAAEIRDMLNDKE